MNAIFDASSLMLRRCFGPVAKGTALALCFLIFAGCHSEPDHVGIEIIQRYTQDVDIQSRGSDFPIYIISRYCGFDKDDPLVLNNGHVVIFVVDDKVTMIGWDAEDLSRGGMVQVDSSKLDGFSVQHGKRWWLKVAEQDSRFSISSH
ncbi:MAG: hypothetical protein SD837_08025 [Candidatus Electrothrix scaldis]|nr:MAG: hypothetical protein SD837_08025 [Candidatus Electrothrix sp. GW3-3]